MPGTAPMTEVPGTAQVMEVPAGGSPRPKPEPGFTDASVGSATADHSEAGSVMEIPAPVQFASAPGPAGRAVDLAARCFDFDLVRMGLFSVRAECSWSGCRRLRLGSANATFRLTLVVSLI